MAQPVWNANFQRYLLSQWSDQYQRYYWAHHDGHTWVFFDWNTDPAVQPAQVQHQRTDSVQTVRAAQAGPAREGTTVVGSYDWTNPQPNSHYESLDPSFYVRTGSFFQEGRVFAILFTEPAGANAASAINAVTDYNTALSAFSRVQYNELAYTQVRRFIVVKRKQEHCYAVPIFTYGNQGTKKYGVRPDEHAIAYSYGAQPELLPGESRLCKNPIRVVMNHGERHLSKASRVYFGIHHPIQYNVKVKDLGYVHENSMPDLFGYWNMENGGTQQTNSVTNQGFVGAPSETNNAS